MDRALLIFAKNIIKGKVKTRLAATVGDEAALAVYKELLHHTLRITQPLSADKFVYYADDIEQQDIWPTEHYSKRLQQGNNLGERMANAFSKTFAAGYQHILIIGTDCPQLDTTILQQAYATLLTTDVVIGPAQDGGYYLLGMKKLHTNLFNNMAWSTSTVRTQTIERCKKEQLHFSLLPLLHDVDEEKDLIHMKRSAL